MNWNIDTTEILELDSNNNLIKLDNKGQTWKYSGELPNARANLVLVSLDNIIYLLGRHSMTRYLLKLIIINFIFIGGDRNGSKTDDILMYSSPPGNLTLGNWTLLDQTIQTPRSGHAVSVINFSRTICGIQ